MVNSRNLGNDTTPKPEKTWKKHNTTSNDMESNSSESEEEKEKEKRFETKHQVSPD